MKTFDIEGWMIVVGISQAVMAVSLAMIALFVIRMVYHLSRISASIHYLASAWELVEKSREDEHSG